MTLFKERLRKLTLANNRLWRQALAGLAKISGIVALVAAMPLAAQAADNGIVALEVSQVSGATLLRINFRNPQLMTAPAIFASATPPSLVLDFPRTDNNLGRSGQVVNLGDLYSVNVMQVGDRTRLVLNLRRTVPYETRADNGAMLVTLLPSNVQPYSNTSTTQFSRPGVGDYGIRDINFRRGKDGNGLIAVDLSDPNVGIDMRKQGGSLVVDFTRTTLPDRLRRRLDVTDFATPVTGISAQQTGQNVRLTITPSGLWEHSAYQSNNQFVIDVKRLIEDPNKLVQGTRGGYKGDKLSLNFQNVDIRQVLEVIADFTGLNIVVSDTVSGNLTLRLKDVPWDQALDIVLNTRGLDTRKNGNVLWIAPRDELLTKEKQALESRQQLSDLEPLTTESFQINYHTARAVESFIKSSPAATGTTSNIGLTSGSTAASGGSGGGMLSKRGVTTVDERSNKLFVTDMASNLVAIRKAVAEIDVPVRQVLIEARIVEASENWQKNLGARLGLVDAKPSASNSVNFTLGSNSAYVANQLPANWSGVNKGSAALNNSASTYSSDSGASSYSVNLPVTGTTANPGALALSLYNRSLTKFLNLELSALETDGNGKTISSPRVLTADKGEALIESGVQVPYLQASSSGATSVSFQKAVLALKVKPTITPDGRVNLELEINKDSPNYSKSVGGSVPIDTKHIKTQALVENGGTVVVGGIFTQEKSEQTNKIPLLGDLPILGFFFRNNQKVDNRTELLIFITPKIVSDALNIN